MSNRLSLRKLAGSMEDQDRRIAELETRLTTRIHAAERETEDLKKWKADADRRIRDAEARATRAADDSNWVEARMRRTRLARLIFGVGRR